MIDLKLNELPIDAVGDFADSEYYALTPEQQVEVNRRRQAAGLSIYDTIAAGPSASVGARGVGTSGVEAGAGAGAGTIISTPAGPGESPAPQIVENTGPGSRL